MPRVASAFAPEDTKLAYELIEDLNDVNVLPFELRLFKLSDTKGGIAKSPDLKDLDEIWLDYQPNSLAWPLFSKRLKSTISKCLTGNEGIDWIEAKVNSNEEARIYYIPRFSKVLDVLDKQKTIFVQGTDRIVKPCFSLSKINPYNIFHQPSAHNLWKITSGLYVGESLKKSIQKEKLTGINFEKILVA